MSVGMVVVGCYPDSMSHISHACRGDECSGVAFARAMCKWAYNSNSCACGDGSAAVSALRCMLCVWV